MAKQLLKMIRCDLSKDGNKLTLTQDSFSVQINPAELTLSRSISYNKDTAVGSIKGRPKFSRYGEENLGFAVVFDGTGAVPPPPGTAALTVSAQIESLLKVVYDYQGEEHEPGYVQLLWGDMLFNSRLESLSTQYTLFTPGGLPLRAKVTLKFTGFVSALEASLQAKPSSPDLSHEVLVKDGDTLPLLCKALYGDGSRYAVVARFNHLPRFRFLKPGTRLHFPPLD